MTPTTQPMLGGIPAPTIPAHLQDDFTHIWAVFILAVCGLVIALFIVAPFVRLASRQYRRSQRRRGSLRSHEAKVAAIQRARSDSQYLQAVMRHPAGRALPIDDDEAAAFADVQQIFAEQDAEDREFDAWEHEFEGAS